LRKRGRRFLELQLLQHSTCFRLQIWLTSENISWGCSASTRNFRGVYPSIDRGVAPPPQYAEYPAVPHPPLLQRFLISCSRAPASQGLRAFTMHPSHDMLQVWRRKFDSGVQYGKASHLIGTLDHTGKARPSVNIGYFETSP